MVRIAHLVIAAVLLICLESCATVPDNDELTVCEHTPDSPAKRHCVERLLPDVKSVALNAVTPGGTGWQDRLISFDDYLGIHDAGYERAKLIRATIQRGEAVRRQNLTSPDHGWYAAAGYYQSLGPEWKRWVDKCTHVGNFCIDDESNCK